MGFKTGALLMSLLVKPSTHISCLKCIDLRYNTISQLVLNSIAKLLTESHSRMGARRLSESRLSQMSLGGRRNTLPKEQSMTSLKGEGSKDQMKERSDDRYEGHDMKDHDSNRVMLEDATVTIEEATLKLGDQIRKLNACSQILKKNIQPLREKKLSPYNSG